MKQTWTQRIKEYFWPSPDPSRKTAKRLYSASAATRMNADWTMTPYGANWTLYRDLNTLVARSREMVANSPHFAKYIQMAIANIVGPKGFQLQVKARKARGKLDVDLNKIVAEVFWEWCFAENCTVTKKLNWIAAQNLFVKQWKRDGEVLVQFVKADNPFGFALKFWNVDWLDRIYNDTRPNGNRVIMSVELDSNDAVVGYWLTTPASEINFTQRRERTRTFVSVDEWRLIFDISLDESQVRGVPRTAAALLTGRNLHTYKGAVLDAAKMMAMAGGFFKKSAPDAVGEYTGGETDEGTEVDMSVDFKPASFHQLPEGWEFQQFDPKQPTSNHPEFVRTEERTIATALGVPYFDLSGDYSEVNYSSARVGQGEARDMWRSDQDFVAEMFCRPVYHAWARSAMLAGKLTLDPRQFAEIQNPIFRPRGWRYVDPQKEIGANVVALQNNLATWTDILAEQGIDLPDFLETRRAEKELGQQYGIELEIKSTTTASAGNAPDDEEKPKKPPQDDEERGFTNGIYAN